MSRYPFVLFDVGQTLVAPIDSYGAVYHRVLAGLGVEAPTSALDRAIREASAEMARRVTVNAMQVLGGAGYMKDYPVEKYVRDAMVLPIISGGNEALKYFMSQTL